VPAQLKAHRWVKGGASPNPKGRPKGQIDKVHKLQLKAAATGATPLDILLAIARKDEDALATMGISPRECTLLVRKSAAESCLPFIHRKMPQAIDGGAPGVPIELAVTDLARLTDAELEIYHKAMVRLAGTDPDTFDMESRDEGR
jgi:hypothetical protein